MTYNITLTANHQSLTAKYLPLAAESVQYLTAKVVYETDDWTGREIKAMFGRGCTVYEVPVTGGEITAKQQLNLTAGDWRVWLVGNSARDGDVIPRITTNVAHIRVAPTGGTEGNPFPATPPTVEEQLRADMGNLADLTTEDKSNLVAAINEVRQTGGGGVQPDWNQNDSTQPDYIKNRPFYTGNPVETVLVEESTVSFSFSGNEGVYMGELRSTFSATVGETYKVYWDGTVYECTCAIVSGLPAFGNLSIAGAVSDTGEPFVVAVDNGQGIVIGTADTSASHTFSISEFAPEVVKIDKKYLVQPDWNQNDSTQPDYIKNRPFYTGNPVETVLVEESTVSFSFSGNEGVYMGELRSTFSATVGETYKVYWDGTVYECTCAIVSGLPAFGNLSIMGFGSDTGEPFLIGVNNGVRIRIFTADTSASHTFSISGFVTEAVKIDPKYLPDTVATKSEVEVARTMADNAQSTADNAQYTASNAQATANNAQTKASNAQDTANNAQTKASNAQTAANNAQTKASNAQTKASNAQDTANNAQATANNAQDTANNAQATANNAKSEALDLAARMFGHTSVVDNAFDGDKTLSITSLPACIESIGVNAFQGCTKLALTSLPSGLTSIGAHAFAGCTNLALTSLPSGLTSIGSQVFAGCKNLALTSLPSGLTSIDSYAFQDCAKLALTSLPSGLTSIGDNAFQGCTNLALTSLPSGLTSIDNGAFQHCTKLALTSLPSGLTSIGYNAFAGCKNLALTSLPSGLKSIDNSAFTGCTNLALTSLPSGLKSIAPYTFAGCTNLALTSLPSGLKSIGDYTFTRCFKLALTSLPSGITSIDPYAFDGCTGLTSITFTGTPTSIGSNAFSGCTNLTTINVPWAEGEVANAPWGATNATINYNYTGA